MTTFIIAGASGLVGTNILKQLCAQKKKVIALSRRPLANLPSHASELIIDFDRLIKDGMLPKCDHVFICLGTTIKIAGSQEQFRQVDFEYCLGVAKKASASGAKTISLISSIGADSSSKNFYLKTKGELEEAIQKLGFTSVNIFRPSFLIGNGGRPRTMLENAVMKIAKIMDVFFIGSARKYRSVDVELLAKTMISKKHAKPGINYYFFEDLLK
tara:strand:+ start:320 stop:961 length:642 start_codon:yes stop_codon:yes gene_type:complete